MLPPSKYLKVHPLQLPPDVLAIIERLKNDAKSPPVVLAGTHWRGAVEVIGLARHVIELPGYDGDMKILSADLIPDHPPLLTRHRTRYTMKLHPKQPPDLWLTLWYDSEEAMKKAWWAFKDARFKYYDACKAGDEAAARALDPLHDWASLGYPHGPVPEAVLQQRAAKRASDRRSQKIRTGCCLGVFAVVALLAVAFIGQRFLSERSNREFAREQRARTFAAAQAERNRLEHPPATPIDVEQTMARIAPQLASPAAAAFVRALLTDLSARPDAERAVYIEVQRDQASVDAVDAELSRRRSAPFGSQRMWLVLPLQAERLTADVFTRLGLPGIRFERAGHRPGAPPVPTLAVRITERLSNERYRTQTPLSSWGIDLVLDVDLKIPGRSEQLALHHEVPAAPARSVHVDSSVGPRPVYEAAHQRAAAELHPRIAALFVR